MTLPRVSACLRRIAYELLRALGSFEAPAGHPAATVRTYPQETVAGMRPDNVPPTEQVAREVLEIGMTGKMPEKTAPAPCPSCRGTGTVARSNGMRMRCGRCYGVRWAEK